MECAAESGRSCDAICTYRIKLICFQNESDPEVGFSLMLHHSCALCVLGNACWGVSEGFRGIRYVGVRALPSKSQLHSSTLYLPHINAIKTFFKVYRHIFCKKHFNWVGCWVWHLV